MTQIAIMEKILNKFGTGHEWDIKDGDRRGAQFGGSVTYYSQQFKFIFKGRVITSEQLGNITFGYLGAAAGCTINTLHTGVKLHLGEDPEEDKREVEYGWNLYYGNHPKQNKP